MGFIYSSLNRGAGESVALFDNRIARMLPFVTGKAYFDLRNYDAQTGEFGVYIEWDGELEAVLGYSLPAGGYFVKATTPQAYRFHRLDSGLPVYMKLIAQNGRLYPYRIYVMMDGRPFSSKIQWILLFLALVFFDTKVDLTLYFMYLSMISSLPFWGLDY